MKFTSSFSILSFFLVYSLLVNSLPLKGQSEKDSLTFVNACWSEAQVAKGITLRQHHFTGEEQLFDSNQYISIIEICTMEAKGRWALANDPGKITRTSKFAKDSGAVVAINGTFYNMRTPYNSVSFFRKFGELSYEFTENMGQRDNGAVAIDSRGLASIVGAPTDSAGMVLKKDWALDISEVAFPSVMGSGPILMSKGEDCFLDESSFNTNRHPRSAIAKKGDIVYLIAVDGRSKEFAQGVSLKEFIAIMHYIGVDDALNLDGGGSTTLYTYDKGVVNHPSDNKLFDHNGERSVVNSLLYIPQKSAFSIVASPAEETSTKMNFSWGTDLSINEALLEVTKDSDSSWESSITKSISGVKCDSFDSVYSKTYASVDFYEEIVFNKYNGQIEGLTPSTKYKYRVITGSSKCDTSDVHYFYTAGDKEWSACVISDFHVYSPLHHRTNAAMEMISTVQEYKPFDWVLHLGDITAWGGSYTFWRDLYKERPFYDYMWAGVNGNHDNMTRKYSRTSNTFFRDAAAYPLNGYEGEMGVCYYFKYGEVLFIMLNSESMRSEEGLKAAQDWVKKVVKENPSPYKVVCEHYQWFFGTDGKSSQYERWSKLFDKLGISLALAGNNHIYVSTPAIYKGEVVSPKKAKKGKGTVYLQTPSSDNERGVVIKSQEPLTANSDLIRCRWSEGGKTVGAMHMSVTSEKMTLTLLDRFGSVIDTVEVYPKR